MSADPDPALLPAALMFASAAIAGSALAIQVAGPAPAGRRCGAPPGGFARHGRSAFSILPGATGVGPSRAVDVNFPGRRLGGRDDLLRGPRRGGRPFGTFRAVVVGDLDLLLFPPLVLQGLRRHDGTVGLGERRLHDRTGP